jgi:UDP:flavonoid glycosyltransferase YjiC (YdhE family)
MKIILNAQGTQGDIRPLLALGLTLQKAGHEIRLCAPVNFSRWVSQYGLTFSPVGDDTQKFLENTKKQIKHPLNIAKAMALSIQSQLASQFENLVKLAKGVDLFIGGGLDYAGRSVAEYAGIPYRFVCHTPQFFRSGYHAPLSMAVQKMPPWLNRFCWWGNELVGEQILGLRKACNENRSRLGLNKIQHLADYMTENAIIAAHPSLAPMPPDIRANYFQTGYWHLEEEQELGDELIRFIEAGAPPVFIGFGSSPDPRPEKTAEILQELIDSRRYRFIISKGWAKLGIKDIDQRTFLVDYVPHDKLFVKMAAIVHHGGSGTTHTAALNGAPQVIIPHVFDQYYWGERVARLKIGPQPLIRERLSSRKLLDAIDDAVTSQEIQENVLKIQEIVSRRNGLKEAQVYIEAISN